MQLVKDVFHQMLSDSKFALPTLGLSDFILQTKEGDAGVVT